MVKTKSISDPVEESDGVRLLVSRYRPWHYCSFYKWFRTLGPSVKLLSDWKHDRINWEQYIKRYRQEMMEDQPAQIIAWFAEEAKTKTLTLLCYEPESDPHCHRHLLRDMIEVWGRQEQ